MDGATRRAGAVACVTTVKNPIVAARLVMDRSGHVMFFGPAADAFAREHGAEIVPRDYFHTELRWRLLPEELMKPEARSKGRAGRTARIALRHGGLRGAGRPR